MNVSTIRGAYTIEMQCMTLEMLFMVHH